tara:strand:- start:1163 stop:4948 length:3786 start_codon:yes stop_codon:yes gene_type:complete
MAGYARQSSADIVATAVVRANPLNVEFNALRDTFALATGHTHDGSATEGGYIPLIADSDALNKIAIDTSNNRVGIFVEVSSAAVEQIRIQDGAIVPVTDSDIDLGTSSLEFKDLFLDGTAHIDTLDVDANAGIIGNLTVSGNTTLGDAASDTVTITADVASPLIPSADDTYDLGASGSEWRNLYIDGTANIDALVADTADINGGTADGVVIGGSSAAAGTFTSLTATGTSTLTTVDINGGAIDGAIIGANSAAAITGTTITGTSLVGAVTGDVTGNADTATALATARTIGGVSFDGTGNINLPGVNATGNQATSGNAATATALETARTIGGVSFDGTGNINLPGVNASGNQDTSGNAATATTLATARTIAGQSFNGSANITVAATDLSDTDQSLATGDNVQFAQVTTTGNVIVGGDLTVNGTTTTINSSNMTVDDKLIELGNGRSGSASGDAGIVIERGSDANAFIGFDESADKFIVGTGTFTGASTGDLSITTGTLVANVEGNVTGAVTGNASTATALATARNIAGQSFNGTGNISIAPTDLTGVNATATELNIMDGDTSASSTTLADADRVVVNDAGTMKQVALTDFETYMETSLDTLSNVTTVGALNAGSITSGFGAIDNGSSAITTTGTMTFGSLSDGSITATAFVDEDNMASNSATLIPTQQSVKAYVDTVNGTANNVTGLNASGAEINTVADPDTSIGTTAVAGGDGIVTQDTSGNVMLQTTVDTFDTYLAQTTKTLTNKTLTSPVITGMHLNDSGFTVEGSAADGNDTTVAFTNPTADRTITLPDATGNLAVFATAPTAAISDGSSGQFLTTDGSGALSFAAAGGGASASDDLYIANPSSATNPVASGNNAVSIGSDSQATAQDSLALGTSTRVLGQGSVAIGIGDASYGVLSGADYSIAIGKQARIRANVDYSIAIGYSTDVNNTTSTAIGYNASAFGVGSLGVGLDAYAGNDYALALGKGSYAGNGYSSAIGANSSTQGSTTAANGAMALGGSYASGTDSFAAAIATNSSSYGATGVNAVAIGKNAKASGNVSLAIGGQVALATATYSIAIGTYSRATGHSSIALSTETSGYYTDASGSKAVAIGNTCKASGDNSFSLGTQSKSVEKGKYAYASGYFAAEGDAQGGQFILRSDTTDATAEAMTTNKSTAAANNQIVAASDTCITFHGTITAMQNGAQAYGGWEIKGMLVNDGGTTSLALGNVSDMAANNASSWAVALSADNTNNALKIQVTGEASHNIRWVANVQTSEVTYA